MASILTSLGRTVFAGFVLLALIILALGGNFSSAELPFVFRWLHVMFGVMWIGLLWYFNFVQIPSMPKIPDEQKPAIGKVIGPSFYADEIPDVITNVINTYVNHRSEDESFIDAYLRIGVTPFKEAAYKNAKKKEKAEVAGDAS